MDILLENFDLNVVIIDKKHKISTTYMSIVNTNLIHASSALLPILSRRGSVPRQIELVLSLLPALQLLDGSFSAASLTLGRVLSLAAPEVLLRETRLLSEVGILAAGAIGSFRSLQLGITGRDRALDMPYVSPAIRVVSSVIGITGLAQVVDAIKNSVIGIFAFQSLDPEEQYFILKHRSLDSIGGPEKNCRAVIIDGMSSKWGTKKADDMSWPLAEELYRNCDVRTYRVDPNSTVPVCDAAEKGKKALGGPLDILALLGHGNENGQVLKNDILFTGDSDQTLCLRDHLQPDAQMILAGCNTATGNDPLAERVSRELAGIEVVGFSAYLNPYMSTFSWKGKKLSLWSYFYPIDSQGNWIYPWTNIARIFKSLPNDVFVQVV